MPKPTIFFSHSSQDSIMLARLKEILLEKYNNAIEIFLSSDGQSIPLGRNWVSRIEEALADAKLMMVFLSPNSIRSHWVFFESGYSYSRKIQVVPIGIHGLDLMDLGPPMSLLQGFNMKSSDGLNNIIALINRTFDLSSKEIFTEDDYEKVVGFSSFMEESIFGENTDLIDSLNILIPTEVKDARSRVEALLTESEFKYQLSKNTIYTLGLTLEFTSKGDYTCILSPLLSRTSISLVDKIVVGLHGGTPEGSLISITFKPWIGYVNRMHELTALMHGSGITLAEDDGFIFEGMLFKFSRSRRLSQSSGRSSVIEGPVTLTIIDVSGKLTDIHLDHLISPLVRRGVIFSKPG